MSFYSDFGKAFRAVNKTVNKAQNKAKVKAKTKESFDNTSQNILNMIRSIGGGGLQTPTAGFQLPESTKKTGVSKRGNDLIRTIGKPNVKPGSFDYNVQDYQGKNKITSFRPRNPIDIIQDTYRKLGFEHMNNVDLNPANKFNPYRDARQHDEEARERILANEDQQANIAVSMRMTGSNTLGSAYELFSSRSIKDIDKVVNKWENIINPGSASSQDQILRWIGIYDTGKKNDKGEAIYDVADGVDEEECARRLREYQDWFKYSVHDKDFVDYSNLDIIRLPQVEEWDPSKEKDPKNLNQKSNHIEKPPWITWTPELEAEYEFYTKYSNRSRIAEVDALADYKEREAEAEKAGIKGEIGVGMSHFGEEGTIDSFTDLLTSYNGAYYDALTGNATEPVFKTMWRNTRNYFRDYWYNPIKTGHWGTFAWNHVSNVLEALDYAPRYARAIGASKTEIGGMYKSEEGSLFMGQKVFWYKDDEESIEKQKFFMNNGGRELMHALDPSHVTEEYGSKYSDDEKYWHQLVEAFSRSGKYNLKDLKEVYQGIRDGYDEAQKGDRKQLLENLLKVATTPGADFNADSGSLAADVLVESVFDPSLIFGSLATSAVKTGVRSTARTAIKDGFKSIRKADDFFSPDSYVHSISKPNGRGVISSPFKIEGLSVDQVKQANALIKKFERRNDYKDIIFKDKKNLENSLNYLALGLNKIDSRIIPTQDIDVFVQRTLKSLTDSANHANAAVVESARSFIFPPGDIRRYNTDILKATYYIDKGINSIDMAFLKGTLPEYFIVKGVFKGGKWLFDKSVIGELVTRRKLTKALDKFAAESELANFTNDATVTDIEDAMEARRNSMLQANNSTHADSLRRIENLNITIEDLIRELGDARITADEAKLLLEDAIRKFSGSHNYTTFDELDRYLQAHPDMAHGDLLEAFTVLRSSYNELEDFINRTSVGQVIDNVSGTHTASKMNQNDAVKVLERIDSGANTNMQRLTPEPSKAWKTRLEDYNIDLSHFPELENLLTRPEITYQEMIDMLTKSIIDHQLDNSATAADLVGLRIILNHALSESKLTLRTDEVLYQMQIDKLASFDAALHSESVSKLIKLYDQELKPVIDSILNGSAANFNNIEHTKLYGDIMLLSDQMERLRLFNLFMARLRPQASGLSNDQMWLVLDTFFGLSSFSSTSNPIREALRSVRGTDNPIDLAFYANIGDSKVGIRNAAARMRSVKSSVRDNIFKNFDKELDENPELQDWIMDIVENSSENAENYCKLQILQAIMMDPSIVKEYNLKSQDRPVIFTHFNTSGLNRNTDSIREASAITWQPINDEEISLKEVFDKILNNEDAVWTKSVKISKDEIGGLSPDFLDKIYDLDSIMHSEPYDLKVKRYLNKYSTSDFMELYSEEELLSDFLTHINRQGYFDRASGRKAFNRTVTDFRTPVMVVHDYEGFNIPFLTKRIDFFKQNGTVKKSILNTPITEYQNLSENTFTRLRGMTDDRVFTYEERQYITRVLSWLDQRLPNVQNDLSFVDLPNVSTTLGNIVDYVNNVPNNLSLDSTIQSIQSICSQNDVIGLMQELTDTANEIAGVNRYASQYYMSKSVNRTKIHNGLINMSDVEYARRINESNYECLQNICKAIGLDLNLQNYDHFSGIFSPSEKYIGFNLGSGSPQLVHTLIHELTHYHIDADGAGKQFFSKLATELEFLDRYQYNNWLGKKRKQYGTWDYDELHEELAAQVSGFILCDETVFQELRSWVQINSVNDERLLSVLDNFHILAQNNSKFTPAGLDKIENSISKLFKTQQIDQDIKQYFFNNLLAAVRRNDDITNTITAEVTSTDNLVLRGKQAFDDLNSPLINIKAKNDLFEIDSFFEIFEQNLRGVPSQIPQRDLKAMQDYVDYISRVKNTQISANALEILEPFRATFLGIIDSVRNLEKVSAITSGEYTHLSYLKYLRTPDNIVDMYLICRKLYDDVLHFWLDPNANSAYEKNLQNFNALTDSAKNKFRDEYETRMLLEFVDYFDLTSTLDDINKLQNISDVLDIFKGVRDSEIYLNQRNTIYELKSGKKQIEGLELVRRLKSAINKISMDHANLRYLVDELQAQGIDLQEDHQLIMAMSKLSDFFEKCPEDNVVFTQFMDEILKPLDNYRKQYLNLYNIRKFRNADGVLDESKLLSELLFNDFHHIVYNADELPAELLTEFTDFVDNVQAPYITGFYVNNGKQFIVGLNKYTDSRAWSIVEEKLPDGSFGRRMVSDNFVGNVYQRNVYESIPFPEYEKLFSEVDGDFKELYESYIELYHDIERLSKHRDFYDAHGTLGHIITQAEFARYFENCPPDIKDGLIIPDLNLNGRTIYDPGFVNSGSQDNLINIIYSLEKAHKTSESGVLAANYMFGGSVPNRFSDMIKGFSDKEVTDVLKDDLDWAIVDIVPAGSRYGFNLVERPIRTTLDVTNARNSKSIVLPYEIFKKFQAEVNVYDDNDFLKVLNRFLLIQKAFALCKPAAIVRNYIDATMRGFANETMGGPTDRLSMLAYQGIAIKNYHQFMKILLKEGDSIRLGDWESVCIRNGVNISYDDFMLFKGMYDAQQYDCAPLISNKTGVRHTVSEPAKQNLENLPVKDAWEHLTVLNHYGKIKLNISRSDFRRIYENGFDIIDSVELRREYQETLQHLYNNLDTGELSWVNRRTKNVFYPFNMSELLAKYAQLLYMRDNGLNASQRLKNIHYSQAQTIAPNRFASQMELIFPFVTYNYKTIQFWMDLIEKNPRFYRVWLEHVYGSVFEQNIESSLAENGVWDYEQDYNTNQGGLPVPGLNGVYFKLNPSFFDAVDLMYGGLPQSFRRISPPVRLAARYSMYYLGVNSNMFLGDIDLDMSDETFNEQLLSIIPGVNTLSDMYENYLGTDSYRWDKIDEPIPKFLVKYLPKLFSYSSKKEERSASTFEDFQKELREQGKFYDCNLRKIVAYSERNEYGLNDPNLTFEDRQALMFVKFGLVWDANVSEYVLPDDLTEGGLNQEFDLDNDPEAWDRLEKEYKKVGKAFDYNIGKFVPENELSSGGLNNPDNDFDTIRQLYIEKFGRYYDANQNAFVTIDNFIPGGLNDLDKINSVSDWYKVQAYRKALFGETYVKDPHYEDGKLVKGRFVKTEEPKVVILANMVGRKEYDNYFNRLAIPRLAEVMAKDVVYKNGFLMTKDGKYLLLNNADYNRRVLDQFYTGGGWNSFGRKFYKYRPFTKNPKIVRSKNNYNYTYAYAYASKDLDDFYRYEYNYKYNYRSSIPKPIKQIRRRMTQHLVHPYGGGFNKWSYYQH